MTGGCVVLVLIMIIGAILGSFANVCIYRIPRKESILYPPSHCPQCGSNLRAKDLVPLLSFLWLGGRCRYCKVVVPIRYFLVELLMTLGFMGLWMVSDSVGQFIWYVGNFFVLLVLGFIDLEHMILPNSLIIIGILFGLTLSALGFGPRVASALFGAVTGFAVLAVAGMASGGKIGAGDMKLLAYIGTLVGAVQIFIVLFLASLLGVMIYVPRMILAGQKVRGQMVPFGPYLATAAVVCMVFGQEILKMWLG